MEAAARFDDERSRTGNDTTVGCGVRRKMDDLVATLRQGVVCHVVRENRAGDVAAAPKR